MTGNNGVSRRKMLAAAGSVLAAPFVIGRSAWAAWPDKPIKMLVPNPPGGPTDIMARLIAPPLGEALGATIYVENKPGAGGNIGIGAAARSEPDGYTLLCVSNTFMINPGQFDPLPYNPYKDFAPISFMASMPNCVLVDAKLGVSSMKELVALAKKEAGKLNATTSGLGTAPHIGFEFWRKQEGLDIAYMPTGGSGPAMQALVSSTVSIYWGALASARGHIDSGAAKPIALLGAKRWFDLPEVPTWGELGYPPPDYGTIQNLFAPAGTPPEIVARISAAIVGYLKKPETAERLRKSGAEPVASSPDELRALVEREVPLWTAISERIGVKAKKG